MRRYSVSSMGEDAGNEWASYEASISSISVVWNVFRPNSEISHRTHAQVMEADAAVRTEWAKLSQNRPELNLTAIIEIVARRHSIFPLPCEFTKFSVKGGRNGRETGRKHALTRIPEKADRAIQLAGVYKTRTSSGVIRGSSETITRVLYGDIEIGGYRG